MAYKDINKRKAKSRERYAKNPQKKLIQQKSFITHLQRAYSRLVGRTKGKGCKSPKHYIGLSYLSRDEFFTFALNNKKYKKLWKNWSRSNYDIRLTPSVNRKDSSKGYELGNIEFITFSENCALAHINRTNYRGKYSK